MKPILVSLLMLISTLTYAQIPPSVKELMKDQQELMEYIDQMKEELMANPDEEPSEQELEAMEKEIMRRMGMIADTQRIQQIEAAVMKPLISEVYNEESIVLEAGGKDSVLHLAKLFFDEVVKDVAFQNRLVLQRELELLNKADECTVLARKMSGQGSLLFGFSDDRNMAVAMITGAFLACPDDALTAANFAGYLRVIGANKRAIPALLYALELSPGAPILLTQLGYSCFELGDLDKAKSYFDAALKSDGDFGPAHLGLSNVYRVKGNIGLAMEEMLKSATQFFAPGMTQQMTALKQQSGELSKSQAQNLQDILKPDVYQADVEKRVRIPKLYIGQDIFDWLGAGLPMAQEKLLAFTKQYDRFQQQYKLNHNVNFTTDISYEQEFFVVGEILELLYLLNSEYANYMSEQKSKMDNDLLERHLLVLDKMQSETKVMMACATGCGDNQNCIENCELRFKQNMCPYYLRFDKAVMSYFDQFAHDFAQYQQQCRSLIDDVYAFTQPWMERMESPQWRLAAEYQRKAFAYAVAYNCYLQWNGFAHTVYGIDEATCLELYRTPPKSEEVEDFSDQDLSEDECDPDTKFKLEVAICEIGFDCESIETGCSFGLSFSGSHNFRKNTTTFFGGVGVQGNIGPVGASAKAGAVITIGPDGVQDGGFKGEVSVSKGWGPLKVGESFSTTTTMMGGTSFSRQNEVGLRFLQ